jgi:hypothetical protein
MRDQRPHELNALGRLQINSKAALAKVILPEIRATVILVAPKVFSDDRPFRFNYLSTQRAQK